MSKGIQTCSSKVEELLKNNPELRDSDKLLWLYYLNKHHDLTFILGTHVYLILKNIIINDKTPTMESITRARRKIQESGLYRGKAYKAKQEEQGDVKDVLGYKGKK